MCATRWRDKGVCSSLGQCRSRLSLPMSSRWIWRAASSSSVRRESSSPVSNSACSTSASRPLAADASMVARSSPASTSWPSCWPRRRRLTRPGAPLAGSPDQIAIRTRDRARRQHRCREDDTGRALPQQVLTQLLAQDNLDARAGRSPGQRTSPGTRPSPRRTPESSPRPDPRPTAIGAGRRRRSVPAPGRRQRRSSTRTSR